MIDEFDYDFLQWYHWAYCLEDFETITLYKKHKEAAYSGWAAARDRLLGGPGQHMTKLKSIVHT